jgi:hypothetical protein
MRRKGHNSSVPIAIVCLPTKNPNPRLMDNLPGWFLKELAAA